MSSEQPDQTALEILGDLTRDVLVDVRSLGLAVKETQMQNALLKAQLDRVSEELDEFKEQVEPLLSVAAERSYKLKLTELWQNGFIRLVTIVIGGAAGIAAAAKVIYEMLQK